MASNVVDKYTCSICLDRFNQPKFLDCHHTFCLECLEDYTKDCTGSFHCPLCRRKVRLPKGGIKSLSSNFYIDTEIVVNVLDSCIHHKNKRAKRYCKQCSQAVCSKCFTIQHNHHDFLDLESKNTFKEATEEIISLKKQLTDYKQRLQSIGDSIDVQNSELNFATKIAYDEIDARVENICTVAKQFGKQLRGVITDISEKQQAELDTVNIKIRELSSDVKSALTLSEEITKHSQVSFIHVLNTVKSSKNIIEKQLKFKLPGIPAKIFPVFNEEYANVLSSVDQLGQCKTAFEVKWDCSFNFKDLTERNICLPDMETAHGLSCYRLFAKYYKYDSKLGLFLEVLPSAEPDSCHVSRITITLHSRVDSKSITRTYKFNDTRPWIFPTVRWASSIDWVKVVNPANGYLHDNKLTVSATEIHTIKQVDYVMLFIFMFVMVCLCYVCTIYFKKT